MCNVAIHTIVYTLMPSELVYRVLARKYHVLRIFAGIALQIFTRMLARNMRVFLVTILPEWSSDGMKYGTEYEGGEVLLI